MGGSGKRDERGHGTQERKRDRLHLVFSLRAVGFRHPPGEPGASESELTQPMPSCKGVILKKNAF
jgi:hypothetical protein